jgi:hypothetical protein
LWIRLLIESLGGKGRLLSYGARLALLKACLVSIHIYLMPLIRFPKWAIEAINSQMTNFFWDDQGDNHRYHLSKWHSLAQKNWWVGYPWLKRSEPMLIGCLDL